MSGWLQKWRVAVDKALNYLSLARKAGLIELGEEPVGGATRALKAKLVVVASDSGDHTWRRAKSFVAGTDQVCVRVPYTKDEMGQATGRTSLAIAAFTDPSMALAFAKALPQQERYSEELKALENRAQKARQRQTEARAHEKNKRFGKKH